MRRRDIPSCGSPAPHQPAHPARGRALPKHAGVPVLPEADGSAWTRAASVGRQVARNGIDRLALDFTSHHRTGREQPARIMVMIRPPRAVVEAGCQSGGHHRRLFANLRRQSTREISAAPGPVVHRPVPELTSPPLVYDPGQRTLQSTMVTVRRPGIWSPPPPLRDAVAAQRRRVPGRNTSSA